MIIGAISTDEIYQQWLCKTLITMLSLVDCILHFNHLDNLVSVKDETNILYLTLVE